MKNNRFLSVFRQAMMVIMLLAGTMAYAQTTISGTVVDASNDEPVIGASVLVKGTTTGTITDFDGNFTLSAASDAVLQVSYMGYKSLEVPVAGKKVLKIALHEDNELLDEVVVVGYGVVKKNDATGSVTAIKPDEMNKGLQTNAQDMLQGKIAGVNITNNGGTPGGGATIRIRGGSSLNASNDPLIVIDGLAMDNNGIQGVSNPLSMVNPSDIETLTVLKDASATAIYGSRASNGVIIITTKKGASGSKPRFSYSGNVSVGVLTDRLETLTASELNDYALLMGTSSKKMKFFGNANTDWQKQIYRAAPGTDHNFSISGGTKNMPYRVSLGYTLQDGTIKTSQMQRLTGSVNLNPTFFDKHLTINLNAKGMYIYNRYADGGVVGGSLSMDPSLPVMWNENEIPEAYQGKLTADEVNTIFGGYYQQGYKDANFDDPTWKYTKNAQTTQNPVALLNSRNDRAHSGAFVGNVEADYKIHGFEDLHLHANFGADYSFGKQTYSIADWSYSNNYYGWEGVNAKNKYNLSFNAYAQYYKDFNENHHFDAMAGYEWQHFHWQNRSWGNGMYKSTCTLVKDGQPMAGQPYDVQGTADDPKISASESFLVSFFGRINYTALNRYMLTATVRADGSSRFAPGHQWGIFPSVALGWKIKEEAFLADVNAISDLKLRLGWGITGQQEINQGDYPYLATYTNSGVIGTHNYYGAILNEDGTPYVTYRPDAYNSDLTWEKTTTYNVGLDFGFLHNRIQGNIDYYYRKTVDLINVVDIPVGTNFKNRLVSNIGSLSNQGVEFAINGAAIDNKVLRWDIGFNVAYNQNKITELSAGAASNDPDYFVQTGGISTGTGNYIQAHKVGYPASSFYVYETERDEFTGDLKFIDRNEDGVIDGKDRYMYHSPAAPITMGFNMKWQFYGIDLGFSMRANIGNYVYNDVLANNLQWVENYYSDQSGGFHGILRECYEISSKNPDNAGQGISCTGQYFQADYFVENASFLRCDNITLGYTFKNNPAVNARIYATVSNPFVISKYSGLDPEVNGGIDNNIYPRSMSTVIGCSVQF